MTEEVIKQLEQEEMTDFHQTLLKKVVDLVNSSRKSMGKYYSKWDKRAAVYAAEHVDDNEDRRSEENKEPKKMLVPFSAAQINTFIAYGFLLFYQRPRFFEFQPNDAQDHGVREASEKALEKDLSANTFGVVLFQFLLDLGRFGFGVFKHGWTEQVVHINTPDYEEIEGAQIQTGMSYEAIPSFVGNKIVAISPYNVFPDHRMPLTRFQEGEFCASDDEITLLALQEMEYNGDAVGVEHIDPLTVKAVRERGERARFTSIDVTDPAKTREIVCVTECQIKLIPAKTKLENDEPLGPEEFPVMYNVKYVNDQRIISIEPANNYHSQFTYDFAQFTPDQHNQLNKSLADQVGPMQEVLDWFINSRISAVKRTLENNIVCDPNLVDMTTVTNRSPVIQLRRQIGRGGIDRAIKPLPVVDATAGHMQDVQQLSAIMDNIIGINNMAQGQHSTGRRSATQDRAVMQGASMRLTTDYKLIWDQAIDPMGKKLLINQRQNIDEGQFQGLIGPQEYEKNPELFQLFKSSAPALIAQNDFFVFDGTLPSEKGFLAQSLQEFAQIAMTNPDIAVSMGIDVKKLLREIYLLRGVDGMLRFEMTEEERQQKMAEHMLQQAITAQQGNAGGQLSNPGQQQQAVRR